MFEDEEGEMYEGDIQNDLKRFENMLKTGSLSYFDSEQLESMIDHFLMLNQHKMAMKCVQFAIDCFPFNAIFKIRQAQVLSGTGKLNEALNLLIEVEKIAPNDSELFLTKASIYSQLKQPKKAVEYYEKSLLYSEGEDKDDIYLDLAMEYQSMQKVSDAIRVLKQAIVENNENEAAVYELSYCYEKLNDFDQAIQCFDDFINENPYSFTAWYNLGNLYSKLNDLDKAIWAYEYSTIVNDQFSSAFFNLGYTLLATEKYNPAIEAFEKCLEIDGEDGLTLNYIAEAYENLEEYDLALQFYKASTEKSPELVDSWLGMGVVYTTIGESVKGLNFIQKAIDMEPENASLWHALAECADKNGTIELSLEAYHQALLLNPLSNEILFDLCQLMGAISIEDTRDFLDEYLENHPIQGSAEVQLIWLNWLSGRQVEALTQYKELVFEATDTAKLLFSHFPEAQSIEQFVALHNLINE